MLRRFLCTGLALAVIFSAAGQAPDPQVLKIGFVSDDPASAIKKAAPFTDYAGKNLGSAGITSALVTVAKDPAEIASKMKAGKIDIYIDSLHPVFEVSQSTTVDITWRRWKNGVFEYSTIFFTKKTSLLTDLKGLKGLKVGFEDPRSTSARWLPTSYLLGMGYKLTEVAQSGTVPAGQVGFVFTGGPESTPVWVMQGRADLGAMASDDYAAMQPGLKNNMKVLGETYKIPRQLVVCRSDLPTPLKAALKDFFARLDKSPAGLTMLKAWEKTTKVDEIGPDVQAAVSQFNANFK